MSSLQPPASKRDQLRVLKAAVEHAGLTPEQLWLRYFALGGAAGPVEIEAYLQELMVLPTVQGDILAQAVNEHLDELTWTSRVPYVRSVPARRPRTGPLAALVELLDRSRRTPPDGLPAIAAAAASALGLGVVIYLADDEQRRLVPLPLGGGATADSLAVDSTLAGRAYRAVEVVPVDVEPPAVQRLYVPLLDGAQRIGVLDITLPGTADSDDPALREECRWLAIALGHLVAEATERGDALDTARSRHPRSPGAELVWSLLPPRTVGTDKVLIAAAFAASAGAGGDAFDYAVSEHSAAIALFDAVARHPRAALIAAAAVAAYRSARRDGLPLAEQARTIDKIVRACFSGASLAGFLGELDLTTGRLSYVLAGTPQPRLFRDGRLGRLTSGGRLPFGSKGDEWVPADATLQRGDWLVLHTDGVTQAGDAGGTPLSEDRLRDVFEREAAAIRLPAETARRVVHAAVGHRDGRLDDDVTVLVVAWLQSTTE